MDFSSTTEDRHPHRTGHLWLLALVCLAAFLLRSEGIQWPRFHPDEPAIGEWTKHTADHATISDKVYANGFFTLARPVQWSCRAIRHAAHVFAYHQGATNCMDDANFDNILFARWFNVWLGTLTCLFLYGLVRRVTGSGGSGVLAAALFAFAQYPVEHSHYGETDVAMVFMLTAAFWLWVIAIENRRPSWFLAAALVTGFSAGTKFPLVMLALVVMVLGAARTGWPIIGRGLGRGVGYAVLGVICFTLGFILANPLPAMHWNEFWSGLAWEHRRVYLETVLNLGILKDDPHAKYVLHLRELVRASLSLGWGWIILALVGVPCAFLKPYRRFWPILLLFPALYTAYWIFMAPWVRTQEFMNYLPVLAALAMLPLLILWRARQALFRLTALIMACAALTFNAWNGLGTASLFGWTDTRLLARQWLERHLPDTAMPAVEAYAEPACPETRNPPVLIGKVEREGFSDLQARGADYVLRAASITGRGLIHPATGRRYPEAQDKFNDFLRHGERLNAWAPLTRRNLATFASPTIELWSLSPRVTPKYSLALELPQPLFVSDVYQNDIPRSTLFPIGHKLGSSEGLLIDQRPRAIALGGPDRPGPVYVILNTAERAATIHVRGLGRKRKVELAPYDMAIVPLDRAWQHFSGMPFERIRIQAVAQKDVMYLPCYARIAFSPAEAGRICSELGHDEAFWQCFSDDDLAKIADPIQRYTLAVRGGRWNLADGWEQAAEKAGAALASGIQTNPAELEINGNSGWAYNALARVRLQEYGVSMGSQEELSWERLLATDRHWTLTLEPPAENTAEAPICKSGMTLPARVARGEYEFRGELLVKPDPTRKMKPGIAIVEYCMNDREKWTGCYTTNMPVAWTPFTTRFSVNTELQPRLTVRSETPMRMYFRNLELRWSLNSALESTRRSLLIARTIHALHRGRQAEALDLLNKLAPDRQSVSDLEIRQLKFQALLGIEGRASPQLADAARDVLTLAPDDFQCLSALKEKDHGLKAKVDSITGILDQPLSCGPFLALVGYALDPGQRELTCVFEVLKNETPPLAVSLHILRRGEWRRRQVAPLSSRPWLQRGERVALTLKLNDAFGAAPDARRIGMGIETDVEWHPGRIPIAGRRDFVIPLSDIGRE